MAWIGIYQETLKTDSGINYRSIFAPNVPKDTLWKELRHSVVGWQDFPESLKFHNVKTFFHPLGPKDYRELKLSKIFWCTLMVGCQTFGQYIHMLWPRRFIFIESVCQLSSLMSQHIPFTSVPFSPRHAGKIQRSA